MKFIVTVVTSLLILYLTLIGMSFVGCASNNTKVVIEPDESVGIIVVEPKIEKDDKPKTKWSWKLREKLRKGKREAEKHE